MPEYKSPKTGSSSRIEAFDSLRGLAACTVILGHLFAVMRGQAMPVYEQAFEWVQLLGKTPLGILWHGHAAVVLFFVLSGFVLYLLLEKAKLSMPAYVAKRVVRLYVPYLAAVALGIIGTAVFAPHSLHGFNAWIDKFWSWSITWQSVAEHLWFLGQFNSDRYDFTIWTLVHEMRISLFFPVIFLIVSRMRWWAALLPFVAASVAMVVLRQPGVENSTGHFIDFAAQGGLTAYVITVHYLLAFAIGAVLACHRNVLFAAYAALPKRTRILLGVLTLTLYAYGSSAVHVFDLQTMMPYDWPLMIGMALLLISAAAEPGLRRVLETRVFLYLGRISYSLYLFHPIVLLAMLHLFAGELPLGWLLVSTLAASFVVSDLAYRCVERPALHLSRAAAELAGRGYARVRAG